MPPLRSTLSSVFAILMMVQFAASQAVAETAQAQEASSSPERATIQLPVAKVGQKYARYIRAEGGLPPYTFSVVTGNLGALGLSLAADGLLSGVPTVPGFIPFSVEVRDAIGWKAAQRYQIRVVPHGKQRQLPPSLQAPHRSPGAAMKPTPRAVLTLQLPA